MCTPYSAWPVAICADSLLRGLFPHLIAGVEHTGASLTIVTHLGDIELYTRQQQMAALVFSIDPLPYGYSLAWYSAMLLASPTVHGGHRLNTWLLGILVLLVAIVFGVCADALKSIAFDLAPPDMSYPTGFSTWQLNFLGVSYPIQ